jgi:GNAT superfamily N-acetyltransferase
MIAAHPDRSTQAVAASPVAVRAACPGDAPAIVGLQQCSLRTLSRGFYHESQVESFIRHVPTLEEHLLDDGTYFVAERAGRILGCGGWSRRTPAYQSGAPGRGRGELALPKVRAMYVHPDVARQGIGRALLHHIEREIARHGYEAVRLDATLPGVPLYRSCGYQPLARTEVVLPDGVRLPALSMLKCLPRESLPGALP